MMVMVIDDDVSSRRRHLKALGDAGFLSMLIPEQYVRLPRSHISLCPFYFSSLCFFKKKQVDEIAAGCLSIVLTHF